MVGLPFLVFGRALVETAVFPRGMSFTPIRPLFEFCADANLREGNSIQTVPV